MAIIPVGRSLSWGFMINEKANEEPRYIWGSQTANADKMSGDHVCRSSVPGETVSFPFSQRTLFPQHFTLRGKSPHPLLTELALFKHFYTFPLMRQSMEQNKGLDSSVSFPSKSVDPSLDPPVFSLQPHP